MARPPSLHRAVLAGLATALALCALPARAANDSCGFRSRALAISLPDIRPDQDLDAVVHGTGFQVGDCVPAVLMQVRMDDGRHAAGGRRRMKHATHDAYLPYSLTLGQADVGSAPLPVYVRGPGRDRYLSQTLRLHVQGAALADLPAGDYSDCILLTVTP